jgi:hypothetical protein
MCDPVTIMAGLSMASAAAGLVGQQQAAKAQERANAQQYQNSLTARAENANQVNLERAQAADGASQKINSNNLAMREAQASALAKAGPGGFSMDAMLGQIAGMGAGYNDSVNQNLDRTNLALDNQLENVNRRAHNEIASLKRPNTPDYLGAALKIGGAYNALPGSTKPALLDSTQIKMQPGGGY